MEKRYSVIPEPAFIKDVQKYPKSISGLWDEISDVVDTITETGEIPEAYNPHVLTNPRLNYVGYNEFHLLDSNKISILVIYLRENKSVKYRFIRLGTHHDLFHGKLQ